MPVPSRWRRRRRFHEQLVAACGGDAAGRAARGVKREEERRQPVTPPPEWEGDAEDFPTLPEGVPYTTDPKTEEQVQDPKALAEYEKALERFEAFWGSADNQFSDSEFDESCLPVYTECPEGDITFGEFGDWERADVWARRQCSSEERQEVVVVSPTVAASWEMSDFERIHGPPPAGTGR